MKKVFLMIAIAAVFAACNQGTESNEESNDQEQEAVANGVYQADVAASTVTWTGEKITGKTHVGTINLKSGTLNVADNKLSGGSFVLDMTSIVETSENGYKEKFEGHLRSADFFNIDSFPTASLVITSVTENTVNADLTIKGITNAISFPVEYTVTEGSISGKSTFSFDRSKYDVRYGSGSFFEDLGDDLIKDDVQMVVNINATKQ